MDDLKLSLTRSADLLSSGKFKDAYFSYLDTLDAASKELRKIKFLSQVAKVDRSTETLVQVTENSVASVVGILSKTPGFADVIAKTSKSSKTSRKLSLSSRAKRPSVNVLMKEYEAKITSRKRPAAVPESASEISSSSEASELDLPAPKTVPEKSTSEPAPEADREALAPMEIAASPEVTPTASEVSTPASTATPSPSSSVPTSPSITPAPTPAPASETTSPMTPLLSSAPAPATTLTSTFTPTASTPELITATTEMSVVEYSTKEELKTSNDESVTPPVDPSFSSPDVMPPVLPPLPSTSTPVPEEPAHQTPLSPCSDSHLQLLRQFDSNQPMTESPIQMKPHPLKTEVTEQKRASLYNSMLGDSSGSGIEDEDEQWPETSQDTSLHRQTPSRNIAIPNRSSGQVSDASPRNSLTATTSSCPGSQGAAKYMSQYSHMRQSSSGVAVIPEGCVDPSNLVEAKRIDGDGDDHLELKSYGPSDHLPMIPISPLRITHRSLVEKEESWTATLGDTRNRIQELMQKQGDNEEQGKPDNEIATLNDEAYKCATQINNTMATILKVRELLYRSAGITSILEFPPYLVAYQLTLVESAIFLEILPSAFLTHSPKTPQRSITASTDFFNYLTRMIEYSILFPPEASGRAQIINHWIKVAVKLHELENFQTLKAVLCALVTPPIKRLKRTWGFTPRKSISKLEMLSDLMSEDRNYGKYREMMNGLCSGTITSPGEISSPVPPELAISMAASRLESSSGSMGLDMRPKDVARRPVVPFLGTFIMDMTYLLAAVKKNGGGIQAAASVPLSKLPATGLRKSLSVVTNIDPRIQELLMTFSAYQSGPRYSPQPPRSFIKASTKTQNHFRAPSLSSALQKTTKYRNSNAVERERQFVFDDEDDDLLGSTGIGSGGIRSTQQLILHYLLTRPWAPERMVDELSMIREPSKNNSSSASISSNSSTSSGTGSSSSSMKNVFYHSSLNQEESRLEDD